MNKSFLVSLMEVTLYLMISYIVGAVLVRVGFLESIAPVMVGFLAVQTFRWILVTNHIFELYRTNKEEFLKTMDKIIADTTGEKK